MEQESIVDSSRMNLVEQQYAIGLNDNSGVDGSDSEEEEDTLVRVLVVDDDAMNVEVLQTMLLNQGVKSDSCMNGLEAMKMLKKRI